MDIGKAELLGVWVIYDKRSHSKNDKEAFTHHLTASPRGTPVKADGPASCS